MVSEGSHQSRVLSFAELVRMVAESGPRGEAAWEALNHYHELYALGKQPEIRYSEHNGLTVRDPLNDPDRPD